MPGYAAPPSPCGATVAARTSARVQKHGYTRPGRLELLRARARSSVAALRLPDGVAVPVDAERREVLELALDDQRSRAVRIEVLDAQQEAPALAARPEPGEQRGARVAQVQGRRSGSVRSVRRASSAKRYRPSPWGSSTRPVGDACGKCPHCGNALQDGRCNCRSAARPAGDGILRVRRETGGRRGKTVTTIAGFAGNDAELRKLAGELKRCAPPAARSRTA